jgi:biopolymer transport protein TolR
MGMATSAGSGGGELQNEPNVVPMIDILLVLLIIFMMIVPMMRKAIDLQVPDPTPQQSQGPPPNQIVLEVMPGSQYAINKQAVAKDRLAARLKELYDPRPDKIIFIKGDGSVKYQDVVFAMDVARGSGVKVIGIPPSAGGTTKQ